MAAQRPKYTSVPTSLHIPRTDVEVWQAGAASEGFHEVADLYQAEGVDRFADGRADRATLSVVLDERSAPMIDPSSGRFHSDYLARALAGIDPDRLLRVMVGHPERTQTRCLFTGYPMTSTLSWDWRADAHTQRITFDAVGVMDRWRTDPQCQVIGRWVHGNIPAPGDPDGDVSRQEENLRLLESQPCAFNEDGAPNCSPHPITVNLELGSSQIAVPVYVFAPRGLKYEGTGSERKAVQRWTTARALLYLIYFYGVRPYVSSTLQRPVEPPSNWLTRMTGQELFGQQATPGDPLAISDLMFRAMLASPDRVECDRTSLLDAVTLLCRAGDAHTSVRYLVDSGGDVTAELNIFAAGDGTDYAIHRHTPRRRVPVGDAAALAANKHMANEITFDHVGVVNTPLIVGGPTEYEITVELVPGWEPIANLDNMFLSSPEVIDAAKVYWKALSPNRQYTPTAPAEVATLVYLQSDAGHQAVSHVGRKWVLNEFGRYPARDDDGQPRYMRTTGVFGADAYRTFDFSRAGINDREIDGASTQLVDLSPEEWARVPRPFLDPLTRSEQGATGPQVDVSFDGGTTWQRETRVWISETEAAISFVTESPFEVTPPNVGFWNDNMWYAIIEDHFRVRVSATVRGDQLLMPERGENARIEGSAVDRPMARLFDFPALLYELRSEAGSVLVIPDEVDSHRDQMDLLVAERRRIHLGRAFSDRTVAGRPRVPWIDTVPEIGDLVTDIAGIGLATTMRSDPEEVRPQIVALSYALGDPQGTEIVFGDLRHAGGGA